MKRKDYKIAMEKHEKLQSLLSKQEQVVLVRFDSVLRTHEVFTPMYPFWTCKSTRWTSEDWKRWFHHIKKYPEEVTLKDLSKEGKNANKEDLWIHCADIHAHIIRPEYLTWKGREIDCEYYSLLIFIDPKGFEQVYKKYWIPGSLFADWSISPSRAEVEDLDLIWGLLVMRENYIIKKGEYYYRDCWDRDWEIIRERKRVLREAFREYFGEENIPLVEGVIKKMLEATKKIPERRAPVYNPKAEMYWPARGVSLI